MVSVILWLFLTLFFVFWLRPQLSSFPYPLSFLLPSLLFGVALLELDQLVAKAQQEMVEPVPPSLALASVAPPAFSLVPCPLPSAFCYRLIVHQQGRCPRYVGSRYKEEVVAFTLLSFQGRRQIQRSILVPQQAFIRLSIALLLLVFLQL